MVSRKDLELFKELVSECKVVVESCGYTLPQIDYSLNPRLSRAIGRCKSRINRRTNERSCFQIELSEDIFKAYAKENKIDKIKNTILHEMCHALPDGNNHGYQWKHYAKIVGKKGNQIITVTAEVDEVIKSVKTSKYKYSIVCNSCGATYNYSRKPKIANNLSNCKCRCGCTCLEFKTL